MPLPPSGSFNGTQIVTVPYSPEFALGIGAVFTVYGYINVNEVTLDGTARFFLLKGPVGADHPSWQLFVSKPFAGDNTLSMVAHFVGEFFATGTDANGILPLQSWIFFAAGVDINGKAWVRLGCNARATFGPGADQWLVQYAAPPLLADLYLGGGYDENSGLPTNRFTGSLQGLTYTQTALTEAELDVLCMSPPMNPLLRSPAPTQPFLLLFEGDDMICRKALLKDFNRYVSVANEKIWAYQLISNYCADWIEVGIGAIIDSTAAAGSRVLNGNFGIRVYEAAIASNQKWVTSQTAGTQLALGKGIPFVFPAWQSPVLIPWMGKDVNIVVEFITADTIAAGTVFEVSIAPIQEGA